MNMPTPFKRASGSIPQSSSHESYTLPPLVGNTVANRHQRGYIMQIFPPYYEVSPGVPITHQ